MNVPVTLKNAAKNLFIGDAHVQEFVTVGIAEDIRERVYLQSGNERWDVSNRQWLLGIDPRVVGIWVERAEERAQLERTAVAELHFTESDEHGHSLLASLSLKSLSCLEHDKGVLFLFTTVGSKNQQVNALKARMLYWRFFRKPSTSYERLLAIAAAYSYPRRVRIIAFKQGDEYDYIFPMDLLADIRTAGVFLFGMRHSNRVLNNIAAEKRIVVCEVPALHRVMIQKLGRSHSAAPPPLSELPFRTLRTSQFGYHIPEWTESYKEVAISRTLDIGSHMLLIGDCVHEAICSPPTARLHHIHFLHHLHLKRSRLTYPRV